MKLKLNQLNPNPFKKEINGGKLQAEQINKIKSNIKELGLMGSLPVYEKEGQYYIIAGHHRVEALKQTFGEDYEVEVTKHDYSDDNILRGMVVENITQRDDDLMEVADNLALIRKYLKDKGVFSTDEKTISVRGREGEGRPTKHGIQHIYDWLSKNGEVISIGKICSYLQVYDNLDKRLLKKVIHVEGGKIEEEKISKREAILLSRVDKKDQYALKEILDQTGLDTQGKSKLVTMYKEADQELQNQVKERKLNIKDLVDTKGEAMGNGEMSMKFHKRASGLILEMRNLRKTLYQFRKEKLFDSFTPSQRVQFHSRLGAVKKEYTELMNELDSSMGVLQ